MATYEPDSGSPGLHNDIHAGLHEAGHGRGGDPARLVSSKEHIVPGQLLITELFFEVPKDHENPTAGTLTLFGRKVTKYERPIVPPSQEEVQSASQRPWLVFLEGGPGFGNREPQDFALTRFVLARGYQMLYLDYRGTGMSTPVTAESLEMQGEPRDQAAYLTHFRADSIVRDLEAVRHCLTAGYPPEKQRWTIFGQSYGGFVSLTYLSKHPHGLREVFMTGGLAPVGKKPEEVYHVLFQRVAERNRVYYAKYPEDAAVVRRLATHIQASGPPLLPTGGRMTVRRLLGVGLSFGSHGGIDRVHALLLRLQTDLDQFGTFTRPALDAFEQFVPFDNHPIYAIMHESIYCCTRGVASNWAADRVGRSRAEFQWLTGDPSDTGPASHGLSSTSSLSSSSSPHSSSNNVGDESLPPLFFSGEMVFPFHLDTYPELRRIKAAADLLASFKDWREDLYDEAQLRRNEVPVYAASFVDDMYVDFGLARQTASMVRGIRVWETNSLYHSAIRARPEEVIAHLFRLRDDVMD